MNKNFLKAFLLSAVYILSARAGLELSAVSGFATLVWLPTGISFAALFLWGSSFWPAIFVGACIANFWTGAPLVTALLIAVGNTAEAIAGVYLFRKLSGPNAKFERVRDVMALVISALSSTFLSASLGVAALYLNGIVTTGHIGETWRAWWIGDLLSDLVIAPLIIIWAIFPKLSLGTARKIEGVLLGSVVITLSVLIFTTGPTLSLQPYWIFLGLIWATLRFGQKANVILTFTLAAIATTCTVKGLGPYQSGSMSDNLFLLQLYTGAVALSGLFFGALGREKDNALRIRTDFISIASHELRTPITALNLSLAILKEQELLNPSPETLKTIEALDRQSKKLTDLVNSLLNVAQIESGNLILQKSETDISKLVQDVSRDLADLLDRTSCSLKLNIQPTVKSYCSSYGMEQVLTNLIMNSMKFGAGKDVRISLVQENKRIKLSVSDDGRGIVPEDQELIFERYKRSGNQDIQGVGLGLYISKLIVDAHHGTIKVNSEPGKGATFTVEIPVA